MPALSVNVKSARIRKGMNLTQLAKRANVSKGYLSLLESAREGNPSAKVLGKLAVALDMAIGDLIDGEPPASPKLLEGLERHRATLVQYVKDRIEDEDWHGLSDAANDLRELDVEIRMTR